MAQFNETKAASKSTEQPKPDSIPGQPPPKVVQGSPTAVDCYETDIKSLDPSSVDVTAITKEAESAPKPFSQGGSIQAMAAAVMRKNANATAATPVNKPASLTLFTAPIGQTPAHSTGAKVPAVVKPAVTSSATTKKEPSPVVRQECPNAKK